jgi:hypothetical protein
MPAKRYLVELTEPERAELLALTRKGKSSARKVKRAVLAEKDICSKMGMNVVHDDLL